MGHLAREKARVRAEKPGPLVLQEWTQRKTTSRFSRKWVCPNCFKAMNMGVAVKRHRESCKQTPGRKDEDRAGR